jgi:hypothetical protein
MAYASSRVWAATEERVREKVIHREGDPQVLILTLGSTPLIHTLFWTRRIGRSAPYCEQLKRGVAAGRSV